jgi:tripartite-type tricarboxylate transporter receptor subunit TctC
VYTFFCVLGPANTPADVVSRLNAAINRVLQLPDVKTRLADVGFETGGGSPQQLQQFLVKERERWGRVIRGAQIKTD